MLIPTVTVKCNQMILQLPTFTVAISKILEKLFMSRIRTPSAYRGAVIQVKPWFWECWTTFSVLQTIIRRLCCCSSTCLNHLICLTKRLYRVSWTTPSAHAVGHITLGSTLTSMDAVASHHQSAATTCVTGPLLFTVYTLPIANIIAAFRKVHHAQYADDI